MFIVIWKYEVHEIFKHNFEELYGKNGKWVELFQTGEGYLETLLIKAASESNQYATIDTWTSRYHYEKFLEENKKQFEIKFYLLTFNTYGKRTNPRYKTRLDKK
jgi:hypothetical protein